MRKILFFCIIISIFCNSCIEDKIKLNKKFMSASYYGNYKEFQKLIKKGADINYIDEYGNTPLLMAIIGYFDSFNNNENITKYLITHSSDVYHKNKKNKNIVDIAFNNKNSKIIKLLYYNKVSINFEDYKEIISFNDYISDPEIIKIFIDNGIDPKNNNNKFSILGAAINGELETIKLLINNKVDLKIKDKSNNNLLFLACLSKSRNYELVKFLIDNGLNVNEKNNKGATPIFGAIADYKMFKILIDNGADINIKDMHGLTILHNCYILRKIAPNEVKNEIDKVINLLNEKGLFIKENEINEIDKKFYNDSI